MGSIVDVQKADVRRTLAQLIASLALLGLDDACILQESDDLADITGIGTDAGCQGLRRHDVTTLANHGQDMQSY